MERRGMGLYVVQVVGGQERHVADLIRKVAGASVEDSFVPELEVIRRFTANGSINGKNCLLGMFS